MIIFISDECYEEGASKMNKTSTLRPFHSKPPTTQSFEQIEQHSPYRFSHPFTLISVTRAIHTYTEHNGSPYGCFVHAGSHPHTHYKRLRPSLRRWFGTGDPGQLVLLRGQSHHVHQLSWQWILQQNYRYGREYRSVHGRAVPLHRLPQSFERGGKPGHQMLSMTSC